MSILEKIRQANLVGRGGACFPVADKWSSVAKAMEDKSAVADSSFGVNLRRTEAMADKVDRKKTAYVVCNAAEGEPGVAKDLYILKNHAAEVVNGMRLAIDFLAAEKGIIYLNPKYYREIFKKLKKEIGNLNIEIFEKPLSAGYIGGEESSVLNAMEGGRIEPRLRPPFPTTNGLWGCPTLINNVETFYNVSLVERGNYKSERFYTVGGDCLYDGVFKFGEKYTVEKVLKETNNYPNFPFFVQVGGDASGEVLNSRQLKRPAAGAGSITIYSIAKRKPKEILFGWLNFFVNESCGQCAPCREGIYRLREILESKDPDWKLFADLLANLSDSAFCGLGCALPIPIVSYVKNVLGDETVVGSEIAGLDRKAICGCFD